MSRINLYSQNRHTLIVDGVPITNFDEGDWLQVKMEGNVAERTEGGDGPSMNITQEQGGSVTISLQPTSPALGVLYELRNQQRRQPRMFGIVLMTGVQEVIQAAGCAFGDLPQFETGGPKMSGRQFQFECLKIDLDTSGVEAVAGGLVGGLIGS